MSDEAKGKQRTAVNWAGVELHYRAGKRSLENIGEEFGVSKGRISQVAKKQGWDRDLQPKIDQRAQAKIARDAAEELAKREALNDPGKQAVVRLGEAAVIEANATIVASADRLNREDIDLGLGTSRAQLVEVAELSRPEFKDMLELMAEEFDMSTPSKLDKANELYRYIISLPGRVKMSKDIAASFAVYIPMQRKVLKLDADADKNQSVVDGLLARINAAQD